MVYGIILAGGKGLRMNSSIPKQYMLLDDKPIVINTTDIFLNSNLFDAIYIAINNKWNEYTSNLFFEYYSKDQLNKIHICPCESLNRTYSLLQTVNSIAENSHIDTDDIAIVHDAARPFVTYEVLYDCITNTRIHKAAMALAPIVETMYKFDNNGFLVDSINKETVGIGQSPFGSQFKLLLKLLNSYSKEELLLPITISQLYLNKKIPVKSSQGLTNNFKITTHNDLLFAKYLKNQ